jgi:hypothetical protein
MVLITKHWETKRKQTKNTVDRGSQVDANGNIVGIGDYIDASGNKVFTFSMQLQIQLK